MSRLGTRVPRQCHVLCYCVDMKRQCSGRLFASPVPRLIFLFVCVFVCLCVRRLPIGRELVILTLVLAEMRHPALRVVP